MDMVFICHGINRYFWQLYGWKQEMARAFNRRPAFFSLVYLRNHIQQTWFYCHVDAVAMGPLEKYVEVEKRK